MPPSPCPICLEDVDCPPGCRRLACDQPCDGSEALAPDCTADALAADLPGGDGAVALTCGHVMHAACLGAHLSRTGNNRCPMCGRAIAKCTGTGVARTAAYREAQVVADAALARSLQGGPSRTPPELPTVVEIRERVASVRMHLLTPDERRATARLRQLEGGLAAAGDPAVRARMAELVGSLSRSLEPAVRRVREDSDAVIADVPGVRDLDAYGERIRAVEPLYQAWRDAPGSRSEALEAALRRNYVRTLARTRYVMRAGEERTMLLVNMLSIARTLAERYDEVARAAVPAGGGRKTASWLAAVALAAAALATACGPA